MESRSPTEVVLGWLRLQAFRIEHGLRCRWRKFRGLDGEFKHPDDSDRARELTSTWDRRWPGQLPLSYLLRIPSERWVRFHSLPGSRRYAGTDSDYLEILRRQRTLLGELLDGSPLGSLVVIAAEWPANDLGSGDSRRSLPNAWPWKIGTPDYDPEAGPIYFWVQDGADEREIDRLLLSAADDQGRYTFTMEEMTWLLCPYDGGVDVFLPDQTARDSLAELYADWLPADGPL